MKLSTCPLNSQHSHHGLHLDKHATFHICVILHTVELLIHNREKIMNYLSVYFLQLKKNVVISSDNIKNERLTIYINVMNIKV